MPGIVRNITNNNHELASLIGTLQSTVEAVVPAALYVENCKCTKQIYSFVTELSSKNILDKSVQGRDFLVDPSTGSKF